MTAVTSNLPTARPLHAEDLRELCEIDVASVRRSFQSRPKGSNTAVALLPDIETIEWHHARENYVGMQLHGKEPKIKGAMVGNQKGKRVWCYWTRMWYNQNPSEAKGNTMHILRLVIEDGVWDEGNLNHTNSHSKNHTSGHSTNHTNGDSVHHSHDSAIAALLAMAQREAAEWNMEHIEMWAPTPTTIAGVQRLDPSARVVDRDTESIASLQWFPEHDGPVADKIDWIGNEKYGWC